MTNYFVLLLLIIGIIPVSSEVNSTIYIEKNEIIGNRKVIYFPHQTDPYIYLQNISLNVTLQNDNHNIFTIYLAGLLPYHKCNHSYSLSVELNESANKIGFIMIDNIGPAVLNLSLILIYNQSTSYPNHNSSNDSLLWLIGAVPLCLIVLFILCIIGIDKYVEYNIKTQHSCVNVSTPLLNTIVSQ